MVKCVGTILFVFVLAHSVVAQELALLQGAHTYTSIQFTDFEQPNVPLLVNPPGERMARTGRTLTLVGAAMFVGGLVYFNTGSSNTTDTTEDGMTEGFVITAMVSGTMMMVPGVFCWTIGSSRYKAYQQHYKGSVAIGRHGLGLRYHF